MVVGVEHSESLLITTATTIVIIPIIIIFMDVNNVNHFHTLFNDFVMGPLGIQII